ERYPDDRRAEMVRFRLADSHRLEAGSIRAALEAALPRSQRDALETSRSEHLRAGRDLFERVKSALGMRDAARLNPVEKTYLRNDWFYAGDCAFELGDYDGAVAAYEAARQRYADDPASLVAMAQIVTAYVEQGKLPEARAA